GEHIHGILRRPTAHEPNHLHRRLLRARASPRANLSFESGGNGTILQPISRWLGRPMSEAGQAPPPPPLPGMSVFTPISTVMSQSRDRRLPASRRHWIIAVTLLKFSLTSREKTS